MQLFGQCGSHIVCIGMLISIYVYLVKILTELTIFSHPEYVIHILSLSTLMNTCGVAYLLQGDQVHQVYQVRVYIHNICQIPAHKTHTHTHTHTHLRISVHPPS